MAAAKEGLKAKMSMDVVLCRVGKTQLPFMDAAAGEYQLVSPDLAVVDRGSPLAEDLVEKIAGKLLEFSPGGPALERKMRGKPDLGAYECHPTP